ncbi:glutathione S-transferase [Trichocoleus sp. FACHB-591]|uniref:glutathione S-transferase family protein n=1 Tax=Trichocoleus sp. FACHB-591 TaxID=2692872 RepID=UPI001687B017|nr:glutathione S-transferase family protein [Trichocoleus sp. FACHB-591]MBD2097080.1 glutathione S-transferase [Trichocoleus sp. FACHB-591]
MNPSLESPTLRLITIPVSHYCEKARWALDRLQVDYVEEAHAPLFSRLATWQLGAGAQVPVLVTQTEVVADSTRILQYSDHVFASEHKLYPNDPDLRREVEELEELFDTRLGVSLRCWVYFHLLPRKDLTLKMWCEGTPTLEQRLSRTLFPLTRQLITQALDVNAESETTAFSETKNIFEMVNQRLSDGRRYLVGNTFTAADLTFAALAAPVLMPKEYGVTLFEFEELPPEMAVQVAKLQAMPAAAYALRLFREERHNVQPTSANLAGG